VKKSEKKCEKPNKPNLSGWPDPTDPGPAKIPWPWPSLACGQSIQWTPIIPAGRSGLVWNPLESTGLD